MAERARCVNCTEHIAYECDKNFMHACALSLSIGVAGTRPTSLPAEENGEFTLKQYAPGSPESMNYALHWREYFMKKLFKEQAKLDCGLTIEDLALSLYFAEQELCAERPEAVAEFESSTGKLCDSAQSSDENIG